jgi:hypothetical protein
MLHRIAATLALLLALGGQANATQVCGWLKETLKRDRLLEVELWLEADGETDFLYRIGGDGIVTTSGKSNSPGSGTYVLHARKPEKPWAFGSTLDPPGKIDITVELHQTPADIFSDAPTPLLARFTFRRDVPATEKKPPPTLAKKQCVVMGKG